MTTRVLLTACGCPGGPSVARQLREAGFWVLGTDYNPHASGRFYVEAFEVSPRGDDPDFVPLLVELCREYGISVVLPESSAEVLALAGGRHLFEAIGVKVMVSRYSAVSVALNKADTYTMLEGAGVPLPHWRMVANYDELFEAVRDLGFPSERVVLKRPAGKGGRGFWVLQATVDRMDLNMRQWPNSQIVTVVDLTAREPDWPLMVMEYLQGDESSADTFDCYNNEETFGFTKIRRDCRMGLHFSHEAKHDWNLMRLGWRVVDTLGLEYFCNVQFMDGKLLEVNPRISTTLQAPGFNFPAAGVRAALGLDPEIRELPDGTRAQYYHNLRSW
jgi:carbamoyl-phosphate synthase large subunit